MITAVIVILWASACFAAPPLLALVMRGAQHLPPPPSPGYFAQWAWGGLGGASAAVITAAMTGEGWVNVAAFGASALLALVLWWHSRRKRRKVLRALGAKAKARIAAMKRKMPRTSPGLVPQGVRA